MITLEVGLYNLYLMNGPKTTGMFTRSYFILLPFGPEILAHAQYNLKLFKRTGRNVVQFTDYPHT